MYHLSRKRGEKACNMNSSPGVYCSAPEDLKHCNNALKEISNIYDCLMQ